MTPPAIAAKSAALEVLRAKWEARILPAVAGKVADAHAHAVKAVTDTLKSTPDGRATLLRLNRSPSYAAATNRLNELWTWLAGPSEVSLKGKVRDAREEFYREAARLWLPLIPPELLSRTVHTPTLDQIRLVRAAAVHGFDPRKALEGPVLAAARGLKAAAEQAARRNATGASADALTAWESRTASALSRAAVTLLNDSVEYADTQAGRDLVHPDFTEEP